MGPLVRQVRQRQLVATVWVPRYGHAESDGMTADKIVQKLIDSIPFAEI